MLDSRFFKRIATRTQDTIMYEAYEAVYARSTMVLFSRKTRTPLAALTLKAEDVGCLSMLTGRPSPQGATEPYFQGMLNMSDQVFNFTISNLSDKGMINFNILHTPHRVSSVDPGPAYGVNEGNELRKNQSYTIEADQRNNCKMILKGKTQRIMDSLTGQEMEVALTVTESETKEEKPSGLYFYLSVVPDRICKELVEKFSEGTIWKVVPGFVRRVTATLPPPMPPSFSPIGSTYIPCPQAAYGVTTGAASLQSGRMINPVQSAAVRSIPCDPPPPMPPMPPSVPPMGPPNPCDGLTTGAPSFQSVHMVNPSQSASVCPMPCGSAAQSSSTRLPRPYDKKMRRDAELPSRDNESHNTNNNNNEEEVVSVAPVDVRVNASVSSALPPPPPPPCFWQPGSTSMASAAAAAAPVTAFSSMLVVQGGSYKSAPRLSQRFFQFPVASSYSFSSFQSRIASAISFSSLQGSTAANNNNTNTNNINNNINNSNNNNNNNNKKQQGLGSLPPVVVPVEVGSTQAAELQYGSHVNVVSNYTGHDYAYEHCSEPTVLCMSIWTDMKFLALPKESMETELKQEMDEWIKNKGQQLIESLNAIFKSETCVIDLESEADTIICTCGHQCIHHANIGRYLRRCPLCRSPITAFVKADGIMVE